MENMKLSDSVENTRIDMAKALIMVDEIRTGYLTGVPFINKDVKAQESFMQGLFLDFNRYSIFVDILWDYLVNIDNGLGEVQELIQERKAAEKLSQGSIKLHENEVA